MNWKNNSKRKEKKLNPPIFHLSEVEILTN